MEYINGSKAIHYLRELESSNKIQKCLYFSITAFGDQDILNQIKGNGFNLVLQKPVSKNKLIEVLR